MSLNIGYSEFINQISSNGGTGLLVFADDLALLQAASEFADFGFFEVKNWKEAWDKLETGFSIFKQVSAPLQKEWYDIIVQYSERDGLLQIMDLDQGVLRGLHLDCYANQLVLLVTKAELQLIEKDFQLRERVNLIRYF